MIISIDQVERIEIGRRTLKDGQGVDFSILDIKLIKPTGEDVALTVFSNEPLTIEEGNK